MTWKEDAAKKAAQAQDLPTAITIFRKAAGSHDKLAAELKTTRQTVINWEKGTWPSRYVDQLAELGVPTHLLERVPRAEIEKRLRRVEAEVARIRALLA